MSEKQYNKTLSALWETKSGNALSMAIDARSYDQIRAALESVEIGGKLILKKLSDDTRGKFKNPETAPHYFLEYISKDSVAEFEAKNPRQRNQGL